MLLMVLFLMPDPYNPRQLPYSTGFFWSLQDTKLWIIMEYLGGGSALDLVSIALDIEHAAVVLVVKMVLFTFLSPSSVA